MSTEQFKYVIIGGGLAAGYAARTFAQHGESASTQLCILSADSEFPYERPSLSKQYLAGEASVADILINKPDFYAQHGISVRLETVVGRVDFDSHLLYAGNDIIGYENLMIATGARAKTLPTPGFDLRGVHTLRMALDARIIRREANDASRAVVIGGSFIGMEVASVLQSLGVQTTLVFPEARVWQSLFTPEMSQFFEQYYAERGVDFVTGAMLDRLEGQDGHVERVILQSGQAIPATLVVAGVGVKPNLELFRETPLQINDGILVNRFLETIEPNVFAVGDVARYHDPLTDKLIRFEHWDNAKAQGEHAARGMLGIRQEYLHVPYFFSDVFDLSFEFWGSTVDAATSVLRGDLDAGQFSTWWLDSDGRLVAAFVMDRPEEERALAPDWIRERATLTPETLRTAQFLQGAEATAA